MKCPKCGGRLSLFDVRPDFSCQCGAHLTSNVTLVVSIAVVIVLLANGFFLFGLLFLLLFIRVKAK